MKLYTTETSPFGACVKIQIYNKQLPIKILPPPETQEIKAFQTINPSGATPVLDTGTALIPESTVIMEYLEDQFPKPSMRQKEPAMAAEERLMIQLTYSQLWPAMLPIRGYVMGQHEDWSQVLAGSEKMDVLLQAFDYFLPQENISTTQKLSLADCVMISAFFYMRYFSYRLDLDLQLERFSRLQPWFDAAEATSSVDRVLGEIKQALRPWEEVNPKG